MGVLVYDDRDPAITYSADWALAGSDEEFNSTTSWTATEGATARVRFAGTGIQVFGTIAGGIGAGTPVSSYAIDDDDAVTFRGDPRLSVQYNQQFFQSPTLSPGQHTLTITNLADVQLFLDMMIIAPLDEALVTTVTTTATATPSAAPPRTITVTSLAGSPSNSSPASSAEDSTGQTGATSGKSNTAAIVGGIIGAIVFLLLLVAGFLIWRKRQQRRTKDSDWISPVPARGSIAPFPPPNSQSVNTPNMSQSPYGGTAYPSTYPTSQYQQEYASSSQFAGRYAQTNDAPSELAYYGSTDYNTNTNTGAYPQTYPSNYSEPTVGPNGRVRVNLD